MQSTVKAALCAISVLLAPLASANAAVVSFMGTGLAIPGSGTTGPANPYPATINVSGLSGTFTDVDVAILGLTHTFPDDLDILLVAPGGQTLLLMSDAGGSSDIRNINLFFRDDTDASLPDSTALSTGNYAPTNFGAGDVFPAPAPAGPYGSTLAGLLGGNPNGDWRLFVNDDVGADTGSIRSWRLNITTNGSTVPEPGTFALLGLGLAGLAATRRRKQ